MLKRCPQCGREYSGDYSFCLDDGAVLVVAGQADMPTQVISREVLPPASSRGMMITIGALAVAVTTLGTVLLMRGRPEAVETKFEKAGANPVQTAGRAGNVVPAPVATPIVSTPASGHGFRLAGHGTATGRLWPEPIINST